jgi:hypothetical protein
MNSIVVIQYIYYHRISLKELKVTKKINSGVFLQNIGNYIQDLVVLQPRSPQSEL